MRGRLAHPTLNGVRQLHVALVPMVGFRIGEERMLELGMQLPGLQARAEAIAQLPALGLLTLAALTPPHWRCTYHEADGDIERLAQELVDLGPTLVAISALTASIERAYALTALLRAAGLKVIIGGLHATACPDEVEARCDAVAVGDGEPVWLAILNDAAMNTLKPRYRAARQFDLADAPVPRYELLGGLPRKRLTMQTQRGCPFACDFCGASRLLGKFREKPVANIRAELEAIARVDPHSTIELADDNTFAGGRDQCELLTVLGQSGIRYFTESDWRIGERDDVLAQLADSGCVQVLVGIESLVFQHRGMGHKLADLTRVIDAVENIQDAGVSVIGCFIVGSDGETDESIERMAAFIEQSPFADVQITVTTPFPGSALHRKWREAGRLRPDKSWKDYTLFDVVHRPDLMSADHLQRAFHDVVRRVFSKSNSTRRSAIRKRIWKANSRFKHADQHIVAIPDGSAASD